MQRAGADSGAQDGPRPGRRKACRPRARRHARRRRGTRGSSRCCATSACTRLLERRPRREGLRRCRCWARAHGGPMQGGGWCCGAGGGTRTPTGIAALRIFVPATAFTASSSWSGTGRGFVVWTIPSPCSGRGRLRRRVGAARLVSTPSRRGRPIGWRPLGAWLGIAMELRFPRVWAVLHPGFPPEHSSLYPKSVASTGFATPA